MDKSKLRAVLRAKRSNLLPAQQQLASRQLTVNVAASRLFRTSRHIACYLPHDSEIDPTPLIERIWLQGKTCYLPVISHLSWDYLWFAPLEPDTEFTVNRFGIPEPTVHRRELVRAQLLDLILVPLVGFDRAGNRLGMGGGFYDRSLAFLRFRRHWKKPHLVGLAFELQQVDTIEADEWDVPLQGIATENGFYQATSHLREKASP